MNDKILRKSLVELLRGGQAFVSPKRILAGLKPELRYVRPASGLHSVWEELEHIRISQEDILRYTVDGAWKSPKWPEGYWPAPIESLTEESWNKTVSGFWADLEEVIKFVQDQNIDLTAEIPHGKGGHTYLREVLLVADHNAYHFGQIVRTRKHLGNWPG